MKNFILLFTFSLICIVSKAQENLVPNGDFEFYIPDVLDNLDIPNLNGVTRTDPKIPCRSGLFETGPNSGDPTASSSFIPFWHGFGVSETGGESFAASLFDSRADCDNPLDVGCSLTQACDEISGHKADVGIPENYYATHYNQSAISQYHRIPIDFTTLESDHPVIGRYVGITKQGFRRPGIYCKLESPLKCGFVYTIKFRAVKKSGNFTADRLNIRLCKSDDWNDYAYLDGDVNKKEIDITVSEDGGPNHDQWEPITAQFYVEETNVQYLYIRGSGNGSSKILIDEIEIPNQCAVDFACDATLGAATDEITTNGVHNMNQPLTFFNTQSSKNLKIQIFPLATGQTTPIRTIDIIDPGPTIAWDGKNDGGVIVANQQYRYEITYGAVCSCRFSEGIFLKNGDPIIFNISYTVPTNTGALTFYNLDNVFYMDLKIYNSSNALVYSKELYNPPNTIYWNGLNDLGLPLGSSGLIGCNNPTLFTFILKASNNCGDIKFYDISFTQLCFGDITGSTIPNFNYTPLQKPLENCPYSFNYTPYPKAQDACCATQVDWFIEDAIIAGIQEFKLIRDIQAGPKVVIATNSDIKFLAGREIRLVQDFTTEPGATFLARIEPCTRMVSEEGPIRETIHWSNFPDGTVEKIPLIKLDSINGLNVYPNPTSSDLFIKSDLGIDFVEIYDMTGKMISSEYFTKSNLVKLDAINLLNGIYILQITLEDGRVEIRKVIKN